MIAHSLYLCYFGVREPLVQSQVIPYLRELRSGGYRISLLTFEREMPNTWDKEELESMRSSLKEAGIEWHFLKYHKRPSSLATALDIVSGAIFTRRFIKRESPDILHGRVHVPTLMAALGRRFSRTKPKLLFDIRGFMPEEYTDAGIWPEGGILYKIAKKVEVWLLKKADGFVVLTERAREIMFPASVETGTDSQGRPVAVIPCCVDFSRFGELTNEKREEQREKLGIRERFVVAYVGSFGGWYLTKETADLFAAARSADPSTFAMILTQSDPRIIKDLLEERGFGEGDALVTRVRPGEVPEYLAAADIAVSFIKPCYSKQASSPTKNAEYLACGLPIIANAGIGDTDSLVNEEQVGEIVESFERSALAKAIDNCVKRRYDKSFLRERALEHFDIRTVGWERYRGIYGSLLANRSLEDEG